jgi:translation initiation factor 3 subunit G
VTNISEDTQENDLRELFGVFGRVARVYVGRDRETGAGKGFAFVSFEDRAVAQKAMEKVNGKGYDSLILSVQWSRECSRCSPSSSLTDITYRASPGTEMRIFCRVLDCILVRASQIKKNFWCQ